MAGEDVDALRQGYVKMNNGIPYHILASYFLDVSGPDDPRYDDLLRGFVASGLAHFDKAITVIGTPTNATVIALSICRPLVELMA